MTSGRRARELGRGERVVPGIWRLRLPLPFPGVPHGNAWAVAAGDGVVLFDTGMHEPGSMAHLERAMHLVHLRPELVRRVVLTHAHVDHCGQTAPIVARSGAEVHCHPAREHLGAAMEDEEAYYARRIEVAVQSGVPEAPVREWTAQRRAGEHGIPGPLHVDHDLVDGVEIDSDFGPWKVVETPGHAPSHVCLHNPEHRILISGDHLLGRVSLYFDHGWTPDPVGEFLSSLDRIERLDARLALSGHGKTFTDVQGHIDANRRLVAERLQAVLDLLEGPQPRTAYDLAGALFGVELDRLNTGWLLTETLCFLDHLEVGGRVTRVERDPERWLAT